MTADVFGYVVADTATRAHCSGSGWWMGGMAIWWVIASVVVVLGLVGLFRLGFHGRPRGDQNGLAILERRFAQDEISFDDYSERRAVLTGESSPRASGEPPTHEGYPG